MIIIVVMHVGAQKNKLKNKSGTATKKLIFILDFEALFTKLSPCEILALHFEKIVYLNYNYRLLLHQKRYNDVIRMQCVNTAY